MVAFEQSNEKRIRHRQSVFLFWIMPKFFLTLNRLFPIMKFLHKPFTAKQKDLITIEFDKPTKVLLLHASDFKRYKAGRTYQYRGGYSENSPVEFTVPYDGTWHAVIEKGTYNNPLKVTGNANITPHKYDTLNGLEQMESRKGVVSEYDDTLD